MRKLEKAELKRKRRQICKAFTRSETQIRDNIIMETFTSNSSQMSTELRNSERIMTAMIGEIQVHGN